MYSYTEDASPAFFNVTPSPVVAGNTVGILACSFTGIDTAASPVVAGPTTPTTFSEANFFATEATSVLSDLLSYETYFNSLSSNFPFCSTANCAALFIEVP